MDKITEFIKQHPMGVAIGALALLALIFMRGKSANTGGNANLSAALQSQGINASLAAQNAQYGTALQIANTNAAASVQTNQDTMMAGVITQYLNSANNTQAINSQHDYQMAQVAAGQAVSLAGLNTQQAIAFNNANTALSLNGQNVNAALSTQAANYGFLNANLPSLISYGETTANINQQAAIQQAQAQVAMANAQASYYRTMGNANAFGSYANTLFGGGGIIPSLGGLGGIASGLSAIGL